MSTSKDRLPNDRERQDRVLCRAGGKRRQERPLGAYGKRAYSVVGEG
jgi:hypothetical protein